MASRVVISYRSMSILALVVGIMAVVLQFLRDFWLLAFMLSVTVLGGLVGGDSSYTEADRRQLARSHKFTLEWLLLVVVGAYALIKISEGLGILGREAAFLNEHWAGLILALMCLLMGLAGLRRQAPAGAP